MRFLVTFVMAILLPCFAIADEPCLGDSLIVETVLVDQGASTADVRIYAATRDSVACYTLPISWNSPDSAIIPVDISYHGVLLEWDSIADSILYDQRYMLMVGWHDIGGDPNPPIITNYQRVHLWTIHFVIDSIASPQVVPIDTTYDPVNGSLLFGLVGGIYTCTPRFIPGAIYYGITSDIGEDNLILPDEFVLLQNKPNPFNAATTIEFTLPEETEVRLSIYNILGQKIATLFDGRKAAGKQAITWDAGVAPSGLYFARLDSGGDSRLIKMLLLK